MRAASLCLATAVLAATLVVAPVRAGPVLGVPAYSFEKGDSESSSSSSSQTGHDDKEYAYLVVTTTTTAAPKRQSDDVVPLDSPKERSRFLVTLLMLESLRDKPAIADPKLHAELLADEEVMQEVLKFYETQQESKGKHSIKIPPKLLKKMKKKMKQLLNE